MIKFDILGVLGLSIGVLSLLSLAYYFYSTYKDTPDTIYSKNRDGGPLSYLIIFLILIGWFLVFSMGFYSVLSLLPLDIIGINISKETNHNIFATVSFFMALGSLSIMSFPSKVLALKRQAASEVIEAHEQMYAAQDACETLEFMVEELEAICKDPSNLPRVVSLLIARERVCQDPDKKAQITQVRISAQRLRRHIKLLEDKAYK